MDLLGCFIAPRPFPEFVIFFVNLHDYLSLFLIKLCTPMNE